MTTNKIYVIDYKIGNIGSVVKALKFIGADVIIANQPNDLNNAAKIILPGVSAFGAAMKNLETLGFTDAIKNHISKGYFFLGICIGIQLLFTNSAESPNISGLNIFDGAVEKFDDNKVITPHMGWNTISKKKDSKLFKGIKDNSFFYFVHSYYPVPKNLEIISATANYSLDFCAAIEYNNIFAAQFHPEKSQASGLKFLENYLTL